MIRRRFNALAAAALLALVAASPTAMVAPRPLVIVVIGDSLSAGYGLERDQAFPAQLQRRLERDGLNVRVVNAGVSGDTSAGGRSRLDWALTAGGADADAAIVQLGANDGLRGIDPAATEENLAAMLAALAERGVPTLLAGMLAPPNLGPEYGAEFNALYPRLAERYGAVFYPFFLDGVAARPSLNQADRIHPTAEGVAVIVERIYPKVRVLIAEAQSRRPAGE